MLLYFGLLIPFIGAHVVISEFSLKQTKLADKALDNSIKERLSEFQNLIASHQNDNSKKNDPGNLLKLRDLENSMTKILSKKNERRDQQNNNDKVTISDSELKLTSKASDTNNNEISSQKYKLRSENQKKNVPDRLISNLIKPEYGPIGQKRFQTVKNPTLNWNSHFTLRKPAKLAIEKRSFESEPKMELNNLVMNSMAVKLGETKLETKEAKLSMIETDPGKEDFDNEEDNDKGLEIDSSSNVIVFLVPH